MKNQARKKEYIGIVVADKMDKTIVVKVGRISKHPLYKKIVRKYKKYKVQDSANKAKVGDRVKIVETRPLSKDKRMRLVEVLK